MNVQNRARCTSAIQLSASWHLPATRVRAGRRNDAGPSATATWSFQSSDNKSKHNHEQLRPLFSSDIATRGCNFAHILQQWTHSLESLTGAPRNADHARHSSTALSKRTLSLVQTLRRRAEAPHGRTLMTMRRQRQKKGKVSTTSVVW